MSNKLKGNDIPSLAKVYQGYFLIGAAVNPATIKSQSELIEKHFTSITAENQMKFEQLHPEEDRYTFDVADNMVAYAKGQGKQVRGHTLVWHNQTSDWIFQDKDGQEVTREVLLQRMKSHITTVMQHYKGDIYAWDVVNEAIADNGPELLRESKWLSIIGEDFIEKAFQYAHEADPGAQLFYNDYNESDPEKSQKIYTLVKRLIDNGVPIHGIGLQAHWNLYHPPLADIKQAIERYASLGLKLHITEMDVSVYSHGDKRTDVTEQSEEMKALQADRYEQFFTLFREYKDAIDSVTFWGVADDYTWLDHFPVRGRKNWPFVFDANHQPKDSFWKIVKFK
ncbi:endo-1,4-beta-xylanase [Aquibacillus salsiterrae]|uniref:Beta-xylanase n=1 Tax=Aquibacillus salsiterrae TaxID=2950439 RepID=A0A9X3WBA3_9BACI|nr:endo-1,4-beta-xylanase [Aquibacillus salsiterrae]MDC3415932.1 endo-1,4-beta-xylanase [Aquibacillus salsiterrae]